jgi:hypothetical protein
VVYHACAVTLSMKKPLEEEETLLEDGTIETSDVELKDTFDWLMSTHQETYILFQLQPVPKQSLILN